MTFSMIFSITCQLVILQFGGQRASTSHMVEHLNTSGLSQRIVHSTLPAFAVGFELVNDILINP